MLVTHFKGLKNKRSSHFCRINNKTLCVGVVKKNKISLKLRNDNADYKLNILEYCSLSK